MIWHPLLAGVLSLDLVSLLLSLYAARTHLRVALHWTPGSADPLQIRLEGEVEAGSIAARLSVALFCAATVLLVFGISQILPSIVAGAMCGSGVMTALGDGGWRALAMRGLALGVWWIWRTVDRLNRQIPRPPATPLVARWQLVALPLHLLSLLYTVRAVRALEPEQPVDCCQVLHDAFRSRLDAQTSLGLRDTTWLWSSAALTALLAALCLWLLVTLHRSARREAHWRVFLLSVGLWLPSATITLVNALAPYHYQVLHHRCPWCLFRLEHWALGYPLFAALLAVGLEATAAYSAHRLARAEPLVSSSACERQRTALRRVLAGVLSFIVLAAGPALLWRLERGVWL